MNEQVRVLVALLLVALLQPVCPPPLMEPPTHACMRACPPAPSGAAHPAGAG